MNQLDNYSKNKSYLENMIKKYTSLNNSFKNINLNKSRKQKNFSIRKNFNYYKIISKNKNSSKSRNIIKKKNSIKLNNFEFLKIKMKQDKKFNKKKIQYKNLSNNCIKLRDIIKFKYNKNISYINKEEVNFYNNINKTKKLVIKKFQNCVKKVIRMNKITLKINNSWKIKKKVTDSKIYLNNLIKKNFEENYENDFDEILSEYLQLQINNKDEIKNNYIIINILRNLRYFKYIPDDILSKIVDLCSCIKIKNNEIISVKEEEIYIIIRGIVYTKNDNIVRENLKQYKFNDYFGTLNLITTMKSILFQELENLKHKKLDKRKGFIWNSIKNKNNSGANLNYNNKEIYITGKIDCYFIILNQKLFVEIIKIIDRKLKKILFTLNNLYILRDIESFMLLNLAYKIKSKTYAEDEYILKKEDLLNKLFIILKGECRIEHNYIKKYYDKKLEKNIFKKITVNVKYLKDGDSIGYKFFFKDKFKGKRYKFNIIAEKNTEIMFLKQKHLNLFSEKDLNSISEKIKLSEYIDIIDISKYK